MSDAPSYAPPMAIGDLMVGGTVSRVEVSQHRDFKVGELVLGYTGWQDYALSDGQGLTPIASAEPQPSRALGVLGFTAYMGLLDIGRPVAGETVVVAAASGAVGSVVGQIAKIKGCTVVGIAGGVDKCRYVVDDLGFDSTTTGRAEANSPTPWARGCSKARSRSARTSFSAWRTHPRPSSACCRARTSASWSLRSHTNESRLTHAN
jgi:NADPH-dependent curcumin reductase